MYSSHLIHETHKKVSTIHTMKIQTVGKHYFFFFFLRPILSQVFKLLSKKGPGLSKGCPICGSHEISFTRFRNVSVLGHFFFKKSNLTRLLFSFVYLPKSLKNFIIAKIATYGLSCTYAWHFCVFCNSAYRDFYGGSTKVFLPDLSYYENWYYKSRLFRKRFGRPELVAEQRYLRLSEFVSKHVPKKGSIGLDIGCAEGFLAKACAQQGYNMYGIDPSFSMIRFGSEFFRDSRVQLKQGYYSADSYLDLQFSFITLVHVFEHVLDPIKLLSDIYLNLEVGGLLFLSTPNVELLINEFGFNISDSNYAPGHTFLSSTTAVLKLARALKFEVVEVLHNPVKNLSEFGEKPFGTLYVLRKS